MLGEGYVRLSYANSTENILRALDRMGEFLGEPQGGVIFPLIPAERNPQLDMSQPFCVSWKPTTTTTSPMSCETLGTTPSARNPTNSVNGGTSEGNSTARQAPSNTTARANR